MHFRQLCFLIFGAAAFVLIGSSIGGFPQAMETLLGNEATASLLTRERISPRFFSEL